VTEESVDHLAHAESAVERITDLAAEAAHPGLSGITVHQYLVDIGRMAAEARVHLAALATDPPEG
jgi:hypothetical protein